MLKWNGKTITKEVHSAAVEGIRDAAEAVLDRSNSKAPIDEGTLINSGQITIDEKDITAVISYDTPYAIKMHEDLSLRHANGREGKFLESSVKEMTAQIQNYLADKIKGAL